jgi:large subunit ribosomal protein L9
MMEIILTENVASLGKAGDVIKVKDGYARNYLIPKGIALAATSNNLKEIEEQRKQKQKVLQEEKANAERLAEKLANVSCTIAMDSGEEDKLYGTVTHSDIAKSLSQEGIDIDKKDIVFEDDIDKLGIYYFKVKLHPEVTQRVKLWVVKR